MSITVTMPQTDDLERQSAGMIAHAKSVVVDSSEAYVAAQQEAGGHRLYERAVAQLFEPIRKAANETAKQVREAERRLIIPAETARAILDRKCSDWKDAERRRAEAEAAARREEARKREEEMRLQAAIEAEAAGEAEVAETILGEPIATAPIVAEPEIPVVPGRTARTLYSARVVDLAALVAYVAAHPEMLGLVAANGPALNSLARTQREAFALPGCELVTTESWATTGS